MQVTTRIQNHSPIQRMASGNGKPPEDPKDNFKPGDDRPVLARWLSKLPRPAQGAVVGMAAFSVPHLAGIGYGIPGALVGGAAAAGFFLALGDEPGDALKRAIWPTITASLAATGGASLTPLTTGVVLAGGAALGALAFMRADL